MFASLPNNASEWMECSWSQIEPFYQDLAGRRLTAETVDAWLSDWSRLTELVDESGARLRVASDRDTTDQEAERRYHRYLEEIHPRAEAAEQRLRQKLLDGGLEPAGFEIPLRNMRAEVALFREANLPLFTEERKLATEYGKIVGAQTVEWEGNEVTLPQLALVFQSPDRAERERAWRLAAARQLADREAIEALWTRFMDLRGRIAENAGFPDYRAFRWQQLLRFDYTPDDCARFHRAIEEVVVPAATRIYEKRRERLGLKRLRPWDLDVPLARDPLRPFESVAELESKAEAIFGRVDPELGDRFGLMRREGLLDLENRKGKAPGGYCASFDAIRRPFIFMNAVGIHGDVQTLLHEGGHAFHVFECADLSYYPQLQVGMEFAEVASMAMELLAGPYLPATEGGFYSEEDAARARVEHLEGIILFWPYMAVVDAFQHWVYEHHAEASNLRACDAAWAELWERFMPGVDWSGLEEELVTGWHRKRHIHRSPFYYVEYGLAQLGAVQVWRNALSDQAGAVGRYRRALSLGGTAPLTELYATAGAALAFDAAMLRAAVALLEQTIAKLDPA